MAVKKMLVRACLLALAPIGIQGVAYPASTPPGAKVSYSCQGADDVQPAPTPVTFALVGAPTSVRPGDTLSLSGNLGMTFPAAAAQQSKLLLSHNASIDATDFSIIVKAGGKTFSLKPASVTSTPAPIKTPFALKVYLSYPDVTIPAAATNAVTVEMPLARTTASKVKTVKDKVTFNAHLKEDGILAGGAEYACWTGSLGTSGTIARIPLDESAATSPASSDAISGSSPGPSASGASGPSGGLANTGSTALPAPPAAPAPVDPPAGSALPLAAVNQTGAMSTLAANAPIPAGTVSGDTFVPGWVLALFIAIFPAAAIAYAVLQHRRLRRYPTTAG